MTNTEIRKEIERISNLPQLTSTGVQPTPEDMLRAIKFLRALKKGSTGSTKKATQVKLSGKRVCELFESRRGAYLWVRKDVYNQAQLNATKNLKLSGNIEFFIAQYNEPDECLDDFAKVCDYCNA